MNILDKSTAINALIQERKSVFPINYISKEIPESIIRQILENADRAPTHKLTQPWRFKVLRGEKKDNLGVFLGAKFKEVASTGMFNERKYNSLISKPQKADTVIAICMERHEEARIPEWEEIAATAMAVQNMYLTCTAYNIGCYWSSPGLAAFFGEFHKLGENERCLGFFYMGYYDKELPQSKREAISEKVEWL